MTLLPELLIALVILVVANLLLMLLLARIAPEPWRSDLRHWMDRHL